MVPLFLLVLLLELVKKYNMDKDKIIEIINNIKDKSNKDLFECEHTLFEEYEKTKEVVIELTKHMDTIEEMHYKIVFEIEKRKTI